MPRAQGGECTLQDFSYNLFPSSLLPYFPLACSTANASKADVDCGPTLMLTQRGIMCNALRAYSLLTSPPQINVTRQRDRGDRQRGSRP